MPRKAAKKAVRHRTATKAAAPPSFPQRAGASPRQLAMFEMVRARASAHAAIQGLTGADTGRPAVPGKWSVREHVLHLCHWDHEVTRAFEAALRGIAPSWADFTPEETDRFNAAGVDSLHHLPWEDALRRLHSLRLDLMNAIESVPDEPAEVWDAEHPFGAMLRDLAWNDRHHAEIIKRWRSERGA